MIDSSIIDKIVRDLGANYLGDEIVINDLYLEIASIASDISNREANDTQLYPYIKKAVIAEYLCRGGEGLLSRGEGSISSSYEDIINKLRNDIVKNHLRRMK